MGKNCLTNMVVAKTWGQGRGMGKGWGVSLFSCTNNFRHLSFIVGISQKHKEHNEGVKGTSLFVSRN